MSGSESAMWRNDQARIDPPEDREVEHPDYCLCRECDPDGYLSEPEAD